MTEFLVTMSLTVAALIVSAFAIEVATALVSSWVRLYTVLLPPHVRMRRRAEICSDVFEQLETERAAGYGRRISACRVLVRSVLGMPSDLAWALPKSTSLRELYELLFTFASAGGVVGALTALGPLAVGHFTLVDGFAFVFLIVMCIAATRANWMSFKRLRADRLARFVTDAD